MRAISLTPWASTTSVSSASPVAPRTPSPARPCMFSPVGHACWLAAQAPSSIVQVQSALLTSVPLRSCPQRLEPALGAQDVGEAEAQAQQLRTQRPGPECPLVGVAGGGVTVETWGACLPGYRYFCCTARLAVRAICRRKYDIGMVALWLPAMKDLLHSILPDYPPCMGSGSWHTVRLCRALVTPVIGIAARRSATLGYWDAGAVLNRQGYGMSSGHRGRAAAEAVWDVRAVADSAGFVASWLRVRWLGRCLR
jgi:hypothetical protein